MTGVTIGMAGGVVSGITGLVFTGTCCAPYMAWVLIGEVWLGMIGAEVGCMLRGSGGVA